MLAVAIFAAAGALLFLVVAASKIFDRYPEANLGRLAALSLAALSATLAAYGILPEDVLNARGAETVLYLFGGLVTTACCLSVGVYLVKIAPALPDTHQLGYSSESARVATQVVRLGGVTLVGLSAAIAVLTIIQTAS